MKKTAAILFTLALLAFALVGCGEKAASEGGGAGTPPPTPAASAGETSSGGEPSGEPAAPAPSEGEPSGGGAGEYVPDYSFYSAGLTEDGFFEGITASDLVELPAYKGVAVPAAALRVDPAVLEDFLQSQVLAPYAKTDKVTDRAVENLDTVNIDYTGYVDDVALDRGSTQGRGTDVTIGVTSYIDDFLEQLIGHEPGETFDIFVTFPDPYPNDPDYSGRDARFNVTINYIVEKTPAELTDDVARDYGFEDKAGLLARVEEVLLDDARTSFLSGLLTQAVCPEVPESVIEYFENYFIGIYSVSYGIDLSGSRQELLEGSEETMRSLAVTYLAAQAICEKEGLRASDADLEALGLLSDLEIYGLPFAKQTAIMKRVLPEFILANGIPEA